MNRSQAVSAGVWYNPTLEQRRELKLRAEAFRSKQRRRVLEQLCCISPMAADLARVQARGGAVVMIGKHRAQFRAAREAQLELRAIRNMLDEVAQ